MAKTQTQTQGQGQRRPLEGIRVIEFAGLAPGPFVGMVLADFGADVIRIDKVGSGFNPDGLCRGKRSIAVDPKKPQGLELLRSFLKNADVLIDPFRPGVLERLGLGPDVLTRENERLVYARLTGFQRTGEYANMAGHDINYIALSGVLSMLGTAGGPPQPPSNILGDFAGGSMICLIGILLALLERSTSGRGQIVEADMVTGARYVSSFLLLSSYVAHPAWGPVLNDGTDGTRGRNTLDGGAPWYGVYRCKDGGWMSVGAIEPQFYAQLLSLLKQNQSGPPTGHAHPSPKTQHERSTWPALRAYFTASFLSRNRSDWEKIFIGTDACVAPVLTRDEAARNVLPAVDSARTEDGNPVVPPPAPALSRTPAQIPDGAPAAQDESPQMIITSGEHTEEILKEAGVNEKELETLYRAGAIGGPDAPESARL